MGEKKILGKGEGNQRVQESWGKIKTGFQRDGEPHQGAKVSGRDGNVARNISIGKGDEDDLAAKRARDETIGPPLAAVAEGNGSRPNLWYITPPK